MNVGAGKNELRNMLVTLLFKDAYQDEDGEWFPGRAGWAEAEAVALKFVHAHSAEEQAEVLVAFAVETFGKACAVAEKRGEDPAETWRTFLLLSAKQGESGESGS